MTTISVTDDVKASLLKVASELQLKQGRRVDLNEAIRYLLSKGVARPDLLERACQPTPRFREAYAVLREERRRDEARARRKYRV